MSKRLHQGQDAADETQEPSQRVGQNEQAPPHRVPAFPPNTSVGAQPEQGANANRYHNKRSVKAKALAALSKKRSQSGHPRARQNDERSLHGIESPDDHAQKASTNQDA